MQNDILENTLNKNQNSQNCFDRRKRIKRLKTAIVIIVVLLLILPTIFCFLLGLQVNTLQKQMEDLLSVHSQYGLSYYNADDKNYAFAAEKEGKVPVGTDAGLDRLEIEGSTNTALLDESSSEKVSDSSTTAEDTPSGIIKDFKDDIGAVDNNSPQNSIDDAEDKAEDKAENNIESLSSGKYAKKKVYLTFDDGPSIYTDDILTILAKHNVKATFFVIGRTDAKSKELYKRIVEEGHTLGMHSYSHQYSNIYNSVEDFDKDFTKLWKLLYDTTGYKPSVFRFPGGSDNMVNKNGMEDFIRYLGDADVVYFDWNVLNGDATGVEYTKEQLIDNVINGVEVKKNSIVLMHDSQTKQTTLDSLPGLLEILISEGTQILPLNKDVSPIQMIKADTIK